MMDVSSRESFERASLYSSMNYIAGSDRGEVLLLPEALEDYLTPENQVRSFNVFAGQLARNKNNHSHRPQSGS
jgi:hypothetical protein